MDHPSDDLLSAYALHHALVADRGEIEDHLEGCADCRTRLDEIRSFDRLLAEPSSWTDDDPPPPEPNPFMEAAALRVRETAEADELLKDVLDGPPASVVFANLPEKPKYHTGGVVRKLLDAAASACYTEPLYALNLSDTAIAVASMLPETRYIAADIASLRGTSWKMRANALRLLGRHREALDALESAERFYKRFPRPELDMAAVTFVRATIYYEQELYEQARALADACVDAFSQLGQSESYIGGRLLQGNIAFETRDLERAERIFREILAHGESTNALGWIARSSQVLGSTLVETGSLNEAANLLHTAVMTFRDLGITIEEVRSRWGLARLVQKSGQPDVAVPRLRSVRDEFAKLGARTDAALVTLDMMEAFLSLRKPREVRRAAGNVVTIFKDADMLTGAIAAANWLRQAAAMRAVTPSILDAIRRYFRRVSIIPDAVFTPPVQIRL